MAVNVLGRAWIEVHADTAPFGRELEEEILAITKAGEKMATPAGQRIGKGLSKGIERESKKAAPRVGNSIFSAITGAFRRRRGGGLLNGVGGDLERESRRLGLRMGSSLGSSFASGASSGLEAVAKSVGGIFSSIGSSIGNVGSAGPLAPILGALIVFGIPALIGAVISLISVLGPLLNLLFLLPAAIGGVVAAIFPVIVAFKGFGTAVAALASGDLKAINEALKDLTPNARLVAREVAALAPSFKLIQKNVQDAFFGQITGGRITAAWRRLFGIIDGGFVLVAQSAGRFAADFIKLSTSPEVAKFIANMFKFASASLFGTLGNSLLNFLRVMAVLGNASLPALERLTAGFANLITKFADWIEGSIESGAFDTFMDKMFKALDSVWQLLRASGSFIKAIIGGPSEQALAQGFFDDIIQVIDDLAAFFRSEDGKHAIRAMIILAKEFLLFLNLILTVFLNILATIDKITDAVINLISLLPGVKVPGATWQAPRGGTGGSLGQAALSIKPPGHAMGGDFSREHLAWISEGNKRELVIPMTDPGRARDIANKSGLSSMLHSEGTIVNVYVGNDQLMSYVDKGVQAGIGQFGRAMTRGPRTVGVGG